jgi:signal transduction histidine kinase/ligand-binding sensor domain-containing protein/DNA-binding response OmpR family regulator
MTVPQDRAIQFECLSVKDGLSQLSVMSIFQDSKGFIWFGTRNGLNRYDGYNFKIFRETDPDKYISNGHIECMAEDGEKRFWAGTRNGLNRYDDNTGRFIHYYHADSDRTSISHNNITCLFKDYRGNLWAGTLNGLNRYLSQTDNFEQCAFAGLPSGIPIYALAEDHDENLWIGTASGLYVYNPVSKKTWNYHSNGLTHERVSTLFCDSRGRIWTGFYRNGIGLYDSRRDDFIPFGRENGLNSNMIRCIGEDRQGNILAGTFNGLNRYDEQKRTFVSAYPNAAGNDVTAMSNFSVYSILCDRAGIIWVGTYSGGVSYFSPSHQRFRFHDPGMKGNTLFGIVGPIVEHIPGGLWIGTEGGGLLFYDRSGDTFQYYRLPETSETNFSRNIVKSLLVENDELWIGTTYNTIYRFDIKKRCFKDACSPSWGIVQYVLFRDSQRKLWIGSSGSNALGYMQPDGHFIHPAPLNSGRAFNPSNIRCIAEDDDDMYFGSTNFGLYQYNKHTDKLILHSHREDDSASLVYNGISSIYKTLNGNIWVSTLGGGVSCFNPAQGRFESYGQRHGLSSTMVYAIVEDHDGKLWLSTSAGISGFDPHTKTFSNYGRNNGIRISEFTPGSGMVTSDNEIYFGGNDGFISFYPHEIRKNDYLPPVYITKISINNRDLEGMDVTREKSLRLTWKQSNISVEFSALNYIFPTQNLYACKLAGFDREWNFTGNRRVAYYTNIPPGKYTFLVKGANNDGVWNEQCATLQIHITSPPWNTVWAWTLYVLAFTAGLFLVIRYTRIKNRLETNIRIEQMEKKNMKELHQTKINLFTNFSHELRTPLTLILSPLENILQNNDLSPALHDTLRLMYRNAVRLLHTVNHLMDLRKKEAGHLKLKASEGNLVKFSGEIFIAFCEIARQRRIDFRFCCEMEKQTVWYDRDLLEKALFNLLSNAFKNTPDKGEITVSLRSQSLTDVKQLFENKTASLPEGLNDFILIEVSDTGPGIPEEELEKIFEPFYQVHRKETRHLQPFGSGIGLNLTKGIIELHHGILHAANNAPPQPGAVFRIVLPLGKTHLNDCELDHCFKNSEDPVHYMIPENMPEYQQPLPTEHKTSPVHSLLIVEDNIDVRHYICSCLASQYAIREAGNGKEAFDIAVEQLPDLIVSDIMMPIVDGIQLCRMIKDDLRTGHIPVILLTARVTVIHVQDGFENGADDYVTKPFNAALLITRIKNLIASREKLKKLFGQKNSFAFPDLPTSSIDKRFMDSVYNYINKNLTDSELSMDDFCREIGMSRSNFYRKIKGLSDLTPNELIRNTRLQFAAKYIRETDKTMSEIAYEVGFSSPSYFAKTFKNYFNISPTEMREKI